MNHSKIGTLEAIMLVVCVIIIHTVLSLPKTLLDLTKSATILNIIYVTFIVLLFIYIVCRLFKHFPGMDLLDISEVVGGKVLKNTIGSIFFIYFVVSSSFLLRNFAECLKIVDYPSTNIIFIIFFIMLGVSVVNNLHFNASLKTNLIIIPFVLFSIVFLFFANIKNFTPQNIFPILGEGIFQTFVIGLRQYLCIWWNCILIFSSTFVKRA